jgi:hypothetical protein
MESKEDLIATLVLAREKAEAHEELEISDRLSKYVTRLRREQKAAEKAAKPKAVGV